MRKTILIFSCCAFFALAAMAQRTEALLEKNWKFTKGDVPEATQTNFDDSKWETVTIPHDWAIFGPFDRNNDLQEVAVTQDLEKQASVKTGRTGGLPYVGVGWYRTAFDAPADQQVTLVFDGAMSEARVYVNGKEACFWPFGYNSFHCDVTGLLNADGKDNVLAVRLENRPQSSRWYPGAGLYRNVRLVTTERVHVPVWGTQLTTPHVSAEYASVRLRTTIRNAGDADVRISTDIIAPDGKIVARKDNSRKINHGQPFEQNFLINAPSLWSPETPYLSNSHVLLRDFVLIRCFQDNGLAFLRAGHHIRICIIESDFYLILLIIDSRTFHQHRHPYIILSRLDNRVLRQNQCRCIIALNRLISKIHPQRMFLQHSFQFGFHVHGIIFIRELPLLIMSGKI